MSKRSEDEGSDSEEVSGSGEASNSESENSDNEGNSDESGADSKSEESGSSESESQSGSDNSSDDNEEQSGSEEGSGSGSENESDSNKNSDDDNEDEEDKADSSMNTSRASSQSKSSSSSSRSSKNNLKKNPDIYGIRRSNRERRQPERITIEQQKKEKKSNRRRRSSAQWNSSEESFSEDSDSDREVYQKKAKAPKKSNKKASKRSDSDDSECNKPKRTARGGASKVSYKEDSEEEEEEEEEQDLVGVDWGSQEKGEENVQTIEKVMGHRVGKKGAVGMQTYIYEVERNGDPNSDFDPNDPEQTEMQFLIKWKGWAHIHNTWESEESLKTQKVKGFKKLENYLRKEEEVQIWRHRATPEEVEYMEIQAELERDLHASHLNAERIFAEAEENDNNYFYVKWQNLPYAEATWELEDLVQRKFLVQLKSFREREESSCFPKQCPALKHRPKFSPLKLQPDFLGGNNQELELRDYQMDGLNWLIHSWCKHNSVILADEMGLGKTIQTIAFLSYLFHIHHLYGPFLLVLPLSTLNAWQKEFAQWAPDMNVIVYIGDRDSRRIIHEYEWTFGSKRIKFNAVLTTYEILLRDKEVLRDSCQWAALVIDEAHRLKNEESQLYQALREFKTNHRLLITGTPLQNSLKELWALLHFIMPEKFDDWEYFESQHDGDNMKKGFHRLHRQLEPFLLRRVKKDVEKSLPAKVEQILRVDMTQLQKQYYRWILTKNYEMLKKGNRGSTSSFVNIVMELKKCCNHAFLTKNNEEPCNNQADLSQQLLRGSGKLMLLDKLLVRLNETGHRVLIFSQMVRMLDILAQYLQLRRFPFQRLDGSINGELRRQALEHFNAEGSSDFCFLLSTRAGGLGINLATADTVIIFDSDWNPQNDLQAQARAHRIGQKNQVNIYRLVTKNSIEETIIERAKQKMVLDHLVIQSMDTSGRTVFNKKISSTSSTPFNKDELNAILKFGAEELFKDDEENEEEPMCDIDEILRRAETRDEGPASAGDELLSAFKVASFNIDEEEEVSKLDSIQDENTRDWDEIIPEDFRSQIAEEERKKEMADLYLPPRKRKMMNQEEKEKGTSPNKKVKRESESSGEEESDEDRPKRRGRPRMYHKETVKGFTDAEVRRFFKSFKKFSNPLRRLDTIGVDADMREKTVEELRLLGTTIIERCNEAIKEYENHKGGEKQADVNGGGGRKKRDRGPSFKLSGVSINAKTTLGILEELEPLDRVVPHAPVERASWTLQLKRVKDPHWDVPWGIPEDSRLLRGIYDFGMSSWEQLKGDPALNLGDKILLEGDVKPQAKHLENRAQYLLKLIKKSQGYIAVKPRGPKPKVKKVKEQKGISKEIIENDDSTDDEGTNMSTLSSNSKKSIKETSKEEKKHLKEVKVEPKEEEKEIEKKPKEEQKEKPKKKKKKEKEKKEKAQGPLHITANGEPLPVDSSVELDQNHPQWPECKEKMRPMKKALKALDNPNKGMSQEEQIHHTRKCLIQIGDHIEKALQHYQDHDTHKEWKSLLWQFVSKFTEYDAKKLHKLYKKHKKLVDEKKEGHENDEKESKKEKEKDKKKDREKKKEEERHYSQKRRHEDDSSQQMTQNKKKPYNGWSTDRDRDGGKRPEKGRDKEDRNRDRSRDRDRNYQRSWHNSSSGREYTKESRYPQDFKRESSYNREGFKGHGYHRGPPDWGGRPHHQKHPSYGPPGGYPHPGHYHQPLYGMMPGSGSGGGRMPHHPGMSYGGAPHWGGKGRSDWGKEAGGSERANPTPTPDWVKKDPRQAERQQQQF